MHINRRLFLEKITQCSALIAFNKYGTAYIDDESYWKSIKADFSIANGDLLQLNSGSCGVMPKQVINGLHELHHFMNEMPPYAAWSFWKNERDTLKDNLGQLINTSKEEIAIQRNTTEALNNILLGLKFKPKDVIIAADHEYPAMLNALKLRQSKKQLKLKLLKFEFPISNDDQIIKTYLDAINKKTKYILISHLSFNHGRIMPIKRLNEALKSTNVELIIDGAHSYGHIDFDIKDLGVNYYATSLHKWLSGPHGTGLMYISRENINSVDHLLSTTLNPTDDIAKFENIGTRAFHHEIALKFSYDYLQKIGIKNKEKRLRELNQYAIEKLSGINGFKNYTSDNSDHYAGVFAFRIDKIKNYNKLVAKLKKEHNIHIKATRINDRSGFRLSPNVFTLKSDIDHFMETLHKTLS